MHSPISFYSEPFGEESDEVSDAVLSDADIDGADAATPSKKAFVCACNCFCGEGVEVRAVTDGIIVMRGDETGSSATSFAPLVGQSCISISVDLLYQVMTNCFRTCQVLSGHATLCQDALAFRVRSSQGVSRHVKLAYVVPDYANSYYVVPVHVSSCEVVSD